MNFWIKGEILNHGWTFESWVNFLTMNKFLCSCCKSFNHGWNFESWVKFWIMGKILNYLWTFQSWVNTNCDLLFCNINFKRSVFLLHLSRKDLQYFIFYYGWTFDFFCELFNYGWNLNYGWTFELKVNCWIIDDFFTFMCYLMNYGWTFQSWVNINCDLLILL